MITFLIVTALSIHRPILFSGGLFSYMSSPMYSRLLEPIRELSNITDIRFPCTLEAVEQTCNDLNVEKAVLIAHSSIDPRVLGSFRLDKIFLIDPSVVPQVSLFGLTPTEVICRPKTTVVCSKLYEDFVVGPFKPVLNTNDITVFDGAGHSDCLDPLYAEIAKFAGISSEPQMRQEYREFIQESIKKWYLDVSIVRMFDTTND